MAWQHAQLAVSVRHHVGMQDQGPGSDFRCGKLTVIIPSPMRFLLSAPPTATSYSYMRCIVVAFGICREGYATYT